MHSVQYSITPVDALHTTRSPPHVLHTLEIHTPPVLIHTGEGEVNQWDGFLEGR